VVEANALHGGRIPPADNLIIAGQTVISNGVGASVGLEAAYAQMGGGMASILGQAMKLRRNDLRTLVGAGAGRPWARPSTRRWPGHSMPSRS
jgi:CIC family chloride channel protein